MTRKALHAVRLALLLVAALSMGLHYAVVQMVGWVNMTVEYSRTAPLSGGGSPAARSGDSTLSRFPTGQPVGFNSTIL